MLIHENEEKLNKSSHTRGKIIVMAVTCIVVVAGALVFVFRDSIFMNLAVCCCMKEDYQNASKLISMSNSEDARTIEKYIFLRKDISKNYSSMLMEFDENTLSQWNVLSRDVLKNSDQLSGQMAEEAKYLCTEICTAYDSYSEYINIRSNIKTMMEIFSLINQLYTQNEEGNNMPFTVNEIRAKLDEWDKIYNKLEEISYNISGTESIYLLNYLISEYKGEREDINDIIEMIHEENYKDDDTVRLSGTGEKSYTRISNGNGTTVVVSEPEEYEKNMYAGICRAIIKNIGNTQ